MKEEIPSIVGCEINCSSVVVDGHSIPNMQCREDGDKMEIILDGRWSYIFPKEYAHLAAHFAANAMAIGAGYSHFGAKSKAHPFAPKVHMLEIEPAYCDGRIN